MVINVLADSISMPRVGTDVKVLWENCWPNLLESILNDHFGSIKVINSGKRRRSSWDLLINQEFDENLTFINPTYLVIQIGIVDAAPRIISLFERKLINHKLFPGIIRNYILSTRSKRRKEIIRKNPLKKVYTTPIQFENNFVTFFNRLNTKYPKLKVVILPIIANFEILEEKSPGFRNNVKLYNKKLKELAKKYSFIYLDDSIIYQTTQSKKVFTSDGYHLDNEGHKILSNVVFEAMKDKIVST